MMNKYIYFLKNKWTEYKIKSLDKQIPILKEKYDLFKIIENWIDDLIVGLNDEINNYAYSFQLTNLKEFFVPKILEDFIILSMKKDDFHSVINEKKLKKIKLLKTFINKKIEKEIFSRKDLEKILIKVLRCKNYFNNELLEQENRIMTLNSKIKFLNKEIFDRDINFSQKQHQKLQQKNIAIDLQKIKLKKKIKNTEDKLTQQLKVDYKNTKLTNFKVLLEIPKKANLKIASLESQFTNLEIKQYELHEQIATLQQKNNELHEKVQMLQQKNNTLNLNQKKFNDQTITIGYKSELSNKTLVNNLTMALGLSRPTRNFN